MYNLSGIKIRTDISVIANLSDNYLQNWPSKPLPVAAFKR